MSFFDKMTRGFEAASRAVGSDLVAQTTPFDLSRAATFPLTELRKERDKGAPVVHVRLSDAQCVMTVEEFDRYVTELAAFRDAVVQGLGRRGA
jgi:hypothetical protein